MKGLEGRVEDLEVKMKGLEGRIEDLERVRPRKIIGPLVVRLLPGDPDYVRPKGQEDEPGPIIIDCRNVVQPDKRDEEETIT